LNEILTSGILHRDFSRTIHFYACPTYGSSSAPALLIYALAFQNCKPSLLGDGYVEVLLVKTPIV